MASLDDDFEKQANIVAFCTDPASHQVMSATLHSLNIQHCTALQGDIRSALDYLVRHRTPRIMIADISNSDLPLSDVRNMLEVCEPGTGVVLLGTRNDVGLFRDFLRLGVTDYIVKPLNLEFLSRSLLSIIQGTSSAYADARVGKVITFVGARGGTGTSTLAANTGWLLANEKFKRTLLLDLDLHHGSAGLLLDVKTQNHLHDLMENADNLDENLLEISFQKHSERFMLLTHQQDLDKNFHCPLDAFEKLLPVLRDRFHYLIVDMPRIMTDVTRMLLQYTSSVFVVADPSLLAVRDTVRLLELMGTERAGAKASLVLNKSGQFARGEITSTAFEKSVGHPVNFVIPYDPHHPMIAANMGKPLASFETATGAHLRQIADQISGRVRMDKPRTWTDDLMSKITDVFNGLSGMSGGSWSTGSGGSTSASRKAPSAPAATGSKDHG